MMGNIFWKKFTGIIEPLIGVMTYLLRNYYFILVHNKTILKTIKS